MKSHHGAQAFLSRGAELRTQPLSLHVPLDLSYHRQASSDKKCVPKGGECQDVLTPTSESVWGVAVDVEYSLTLYVRCIPETPEAIG